MNEVELLRANRQPYTKAWLNFSQDYNSYHENKCFGFVEGKEDLTFYQKHIDSIIGEGKCILYFSKGKAGVKFSFDKINECDKYDKKKIVFFRDKDLSEYMEDSSMIYGNNVFITDFYSIENYFISEKSFYYVAKQCLGYNEESETNLLNEVKNFANQLKDFKKIMIPVMALVLYWKKQGITLDLDKANIEDLCTIENSVSLNADFYEKFVTVILNEEDRDRVNDYTKQEVQDLIIQLNDNYGIVRGHFLSQFFIIYCKRKKKVKREFSNLQINDAVIPRSEMPESLRTFINSTLKQLY